MKAMKEMLISIACAAILYADEWFSAPDCQEDNE